MYYLSCTECGKVFSWRNQRKKYCDDCNRERILEKARIHNERVRRAKLERYGGDAGWYPIFENKISTAMRKIMDTVNYADKAGKSYGQYMADLYSSANM